jgi:aminopeptidase N
MSERLFGCRRQADRHECRWYRRRFVMILTLLAWLADSCTRNAPEPSAPEPGVSWSLAQERAGTVSDLSYDLRFHVPVDRDLPVRAAATISFVLARRLSTLSLDFKRPRKEVHSVKANGAPVEPLFANGHIVLPNDSIRPGRNEIEIEFNAGDSSLNRHDDYLYSLFVPDRASAAFPCFDQPDLKARYRLVIEIPAEWEVVANAPALSQEVADGRKLVRFSETKPLSTYFFSFAAGQFRVDETSWKGRNLRLFHRETDAGRVTHNLPSIFKLHAEALDWLEEYTGIPYPFGKFDFVAIPAFQFSGMEHPGAILYRDTKLFLDKSATQSEVLERASLIAHETAHMWFGDLVTMRWFNDVWTKEVFANFMAAKIVNPAFPDIDHGLRFFLAHYPTAYDVDRTAGTHPIRQQLENMNEAASLYGPIIYQKAPIVMRQLEMLIGEERLRIGLQDYLREFAYGNAEWPDLVTILDKRTDWDLRAWSRNWVEQSGRPWIKARLALQDDRIQSLELIQSDPQGRGLVWPQAITPALGSAAGLRLFQVNLREQTVTIEAALGLPKPDFVLPDSAGIGYGRFELDAASRDYLAAHLSEFQPPVTRAAAWLVLYESLLDGQSEALPLARTALQTLREEKEEQLINFLVRSLRLLYWGFLSERERNGLAQDLEGSLWDLLSRASTPGLKATFFNGFSAMAITPLGVRRVFEVWDRRLKMPGLVLAEQDEMRLALELAVRRMEGYEGVLEKQSRRISNPDRLKEFAFVRQAVGSDQQRDLFFASLSNVENRRHEPWVLEALGYLHHPLHSEKSIQYVRPSLEMLEEIQQTGDIFFPKGWLDAMLAGHSSQTAADIVRGFLVEKPSYPPRLKAKLLQSADLLFRRSAR